MLYIVTVLCTENYSCSFWLSGTVQPACNEHIVGKRKSVRYICFSLYSNTVKSRYNGLRGTAGFNLLF